MLKAPMSWTYIIIIDIIAIINYGGDIYGIFKKICL